MVEQIAFKSQMAYRTEGLTGYLPCTPEAASYANFYCFYWNMIRRKKSGQLNEVVRFCQDAECLP